MATSDQTNGPAGAGSSTTPGAAGGQVPDLVAGKTVSQVLGEVVWLLSRCKETKAMPLSDLEWFVMPPILLKQFRIHYDGEIPVRFEAWALSDHEITTEAFKARCRGKATLWRTGQHKVEVLDVSLLPASSFQPKA